MRIKVNPDGTVSYVQGLEIAGQVIHRATRQSRVVPDRWALRLAFRLIRACCRDDSRSAAWTRTWRCRWRAKIIDGPDLGVFDLRAAAIRAEVRWLEENRL